MDRVSDVRFTAAAGRRRLSTASTTASYDVLYGADAADGDAERTRVLAALEASDFPAALREKAAASSDYLVIEAAATLTSVSSLAVWSAVPAPAKGADSSSALPAIPILAAAATAALLVGGASLYGARKALARASAKADAPDDAAAVELGDVYSPTAEAANVNTEA